MSTILFDKAVFGPVHSRRLGVSLGINLLPTDGKLCSFDCLYCECGFNTKGKKLAPLPTRNDVATQLEATLRKMKADGILPDVITFAGNGEPTLHPQFESIMADTIALRDQYAPQAKVCVLTNATRLADESVVRGLCMTDEAILKIDSGRESTVTMLDQPAATYSLHKTVERILALRERLGKALTIQTMFVSWTDQHGANHDNMGDDDVNAWIDIIKLLAPPQVMIYTIDRETPLKTMRKASKEFLDSIAAKISPLTQKVTVSY